MSYLLHRDEPTLFSELRQAGYYVWMNGRNDFLNGMDEGLIHENADEIFYSENRRMHSYSTAQKAAATEGVQSEMPLKERFPYAHFHGPTGKNSFAGDIADTRAAIDRIRRAKELEQPLCLFIGWVNPHVPYATTKEYYDRIDPTKIPPRVRIEDTIGKSRMVKKLLEYSNMGSFPEEGFNEMRRVYLSQCAFIDDQVKAIIDALKEEGLFDNSAIFFLSDHGDWTGDFNLPEKAQSCFEDCLTKVPLIVKPPKGEIVDPGTSSALTELVDFYATVMDYAGVEPTHDAFGLSLRSAIEDRSRPHRDVVFSEGGRRETEWQADEYTIDGPDGPPKAGEYWAKKTAQKDPTAHAKATMIFDGRFKYIRRITGEDELYDLQQDPQEKTNLFALDHLPTEAVSILPLLKEKMLTWLQVTTDTVPRTYDSRMTPEKKWSMVAPMCRPELKEHMLRHIRENPYEDFVTLFRYAGSLAAGNQTQSGSTPLQGTNTVQ